MTGRKEDQTREEKSIRQHCEKKRRKKIDLGLGRGRDKGLMRWAFLSTEPKIKV